MPTKSTKRIIVSAGRRGNVKYELLPDQMRAVFYETLLPNPEGRFIPKAEVSLALKKLLREKEAEVSIFAYCRDLRTHYTVRTDWEPNTIRVGCHHFSKATVKTLAKWCGWSAEARRLYIG